MSFYTEDELSKLGLASCGHNVKISKKASLYNTGKISIGSHVRIDDFCVLSAGEGGIEIGDFIHIAVFSSLIGAGKIKLNDFCNISSRVSIYSSNDDYSGAYMTSPMVPSEFTSVTHAEVVIGKHSIIGAGTIVLPNVVIEDGVAVGSLSLVKKNCEAFGKYAGVPAKRFGERKRDLLELEEQLRQKMNARQGEE